MGLDDTEKAKFARLTDKQRQCLDLVVLRKSSKEIARELGIAKPTVDQRIANARQILGAQNRDEAALIYARHADIYDRVIYDTARVPSFDLNRESSEPEARFDAGLRLEEATIPFSGVIEHQAFGKPDFRWRLSGDFGTPTRVMIIFGLTIGILVMVLIGLAVAQSISGLLTSN